MLRTKFVSPPGLDCENRKIKHRLTTAIFAFVISYFAVDSETTVFSEEIMPNFVIIMADDLGYGDLSCFGNDRYETPNLDKLAAGGLKFTDFHSNGNVCSPTRAALMTGRYQQRAGVPGVITVTKRHLGLQLHELTVAEVLKDAIYRTAIFGKWHLGYETKYNPTHQGFGEFHGYISGNIDFFSHIDQSGVFDWWQNAELKDEPGYTTHLITKHAVRFLKEKSDQPFFLYLPHEAPHYPYQGPNDKADRTVGGKFENHGSRKDKLGAYKEMVQEVDKGIGEVIKTLEETGQRENTLVMFFSDNGATQLGNNGPLRGTKGTDWEGGHRVPCIANWPGKIQPGTTTDQLACTMDIMPTLMELVNSKKSVERPLDGQSLVPVILEGKKLPERTLVWNGKAIRNGNWKYVQNGKGQKQPGLYDLSKDISESKNLIKENPAKAKKLQKALESWIVDVENGATQQPPKP